MVYTQETHRLYRYVGVTVDVHFGGQVLPGTVVKTYQRDDGRDVKVLFDDPLVYGGMGAGWFSPDEVSLPGQRPGLGQQNARG